MTTPIVTNTAGLPTDLAIGSLTSLVDPCADIAWYRPADLGAETNYIGQSIAVYGWFNKLGIGEIESFTNFVELVGSPEADINDTRVFSFSYSSVSGAVDDCYFAGGDSGGPTFVEQEGALRLIGVHTGIDTFTNGFVSQDTSIPCYADQLSLLIDTNTGLVGVDGDFLPDHWETNWFGSLAFGPGDDPDRDGLTNRLEEDRASDPTQRLAPGWWMSRGVINANAVPQDFAAANQGQVNWIATCASLELESVLGAGSNVMNVVSGFMHSAIFSALNLGQAKHICAPFYDRLKQVGLADSDPWSSATNANDGAVLNAGQLKHLFSFDIVAP